MSQIISLLLVSPAISKLTICDKSIKLSFYFYFGLLVSATLVAETAYCVFRCHVVEILIPIHKVHALTNLAPNYFYNYYKILDPFMSCGQHIHCPQ